MRIFGEQRFASLAGVSWLRRATARRLVDLRLSEDVIDDLQLVISEVAANAVVHGRPPPTILEVRIDIEGVDLRIEIGDDGIEPFDLKRAIDEAPNLPAGDVELASGRGLALTRAALDRVEYQQDSLNRFIGFRSLKRHRLTALIVEDADSLLEIYTGYLSKDYRVIGCASLADARDALRSNPIDVVISDYHLGDGFGADLAAEIDDLSESGALPVVLITADTSPGTREVALRQGVEFFLPKPVSLKALRETVALAVSRAAARNARLARSFARDVAGLIAERLPPRLGPYRLGSAGGTAAIGGGDLIIHLPLAEADRIVLIDVMGHGISARAWAIAYAAIVRTLHHVAGHVSTSAFLTDLARIAWHEPALERAMATVLIVDLDKGGATIASAGHPYPIVFGSPFDRDRAMGPLLGVLAPEPYESPASNSGSATEWRSSPTALIRQASRPGGNPPPWFMELAGDLNDEPLSKISERLRKAAEGALGPQPPDDWTFVLIEKRPEA